MPAGVNPLVAAATAAKVASSSGVSFGAGGATGVAGEAAVVAAVVAAGGAEAAAEAAGGTIGGVGVVVGGRVQPGEISGFGSGVYRAVPGGGGSIHPGGGTIGGCKTGGVGVGVGMGAVYLNTGLERLDSCG